MTNPFIVALILLTAVTLFGFAFAKTARADGQTAPITRNAVQSLTREQIAIKLQRLEAAREPDPKMGAMCYKMAAPPNRADYTCPRCSEKTLYTNSAARTVTWELEACRREFELLAKETDMAVSLDESSFCSHCSPAAVKHELVLTVTYTDGASQTTSPVTADDMRILREFLKGHLSYPTSNDGQLPLKKELPRLCQLLGLPAPAKTEK